MLCTVVTFAVFVSIAFAGAESSTLCPGYDVTPAARQLHYTGPRQRIYREGRTNYRCFQGQHWEDLYLFQSLLHNISGGFFIELGALDGYSYSVSYFFEQYLDWRGLLIEASPRNLEMYRARSARLKVRRRRRSPFVLSAVCSEPKPMTYVSKSGTGAGILEFMPASEQKRNLGECEPLPTSAVGAAPTEDEIIAFRPRSGCALIPINCVHLGDELRRRGVTHVDLFVLDVEGAELEVLQTLRLDEVPVRVFVVELDGRNSDKDARVRCILRRAGYAPLGRLELNELWVRQDFDATRFAGEYKPPTPPSRWQGCFVEPIVLGDGGGGGGGGDASSRTKPDAQTDDVEKDAQRLDSDFRPDAVALPTGVSVGGADVDISLAAAGPLTLAAAAMALFGVCYFVQRRRRRKATTA